MGVSVQLAESGMKLPILSDENETLPVGLVGATDVSVTVAVHDAI